MESQRYMQYDDICSLHSVRPTRIFVHSMPCRNSSKAIQKSIDVLNCDLFRQLVLSGVACYLLMRICNKLRAMHIATIWHLIPTA